MYQTIISTLKRRSRTSAQPAAVPPDLLFRILNLTPASDEGLELYSQRIDQANPAAFLVSAVSAIDKSTNLTKLSSTQLQRLEGECQTYRTNNVTHQAIIAALHFLVIKEQDRRELQPNLLLKALKLQTDAQFIHYYEQQYRALSDLNRPISLEHLTDNELQMLIQHYSFWAPMQSERIIISGHPVHADVYHIGDTLLLPNGLFQIQKDPAGHIKQQKIMTLKELLHLGLAAYVPKKESPLIIHDDFASMKIFIHNVNAIIHQHPKGLHLGKPSETYVKINQAILQGAEEEIQRRNIHKKQTEPQDRFFKTPVVKSALPNNKISPRSAKK